MTTDNLPKVITCDVLNEYFHDHGFNQRNVSHISHGFKVSDHMYRYLINVEQAEYVTDFFKKYYVDNINESNMVPSEININDYNNSVVVNADGMIGIQLYPA